MLHKRDHLSDFPSPSTSLPLAYSHICIPSERGGRKKKMRRHIYIHTHKTEYATALDLCRAPLRPDVEGYLRGQNINHQAGLRESTPHGRIMYRTLAPSWLHPGLQRIMHQTEAPLAALPTPRHQRVVLTSHISLMHHTQTILTESHHPCSPRPPYLAATVPPISPNAASGRNSARNLATTNGTSGSSKKLKPPSSKNEPELLPT